MNSKQKKAFDWATTQVYSSVAARHAKTLAKLVYEVEAQIRGMLNDLQQFDGTDSFSKDVIRGILEELYETVDWREPNEGD